MYTELKNKLIEIEEKYGGDITFIPPVDSKLYKLFEGKIEYKLPPILRYFYENESNGLQFDYAKTIYSINDSSQKKTFVENIERQNDPNTSSWFKYKPQIFNDYLVIASDNSICFVIYKKKSLENPSIYICENPNTKGAVILEKLNFGFLELIQMMVKDTYAD